ncbi:MAG TPA: PadR family transcriptional regulator [Firmicutes bacterium]|nr:PadR family transcriptional regulator [Bacillota bacterium]
MHDNHCHDRPLQRCGCSGSRIERFIEPCLLLLLLEKPAHGYDLMERLKEFGFDGENQDPGVVYRNLRRLEDEGMVRSEWDTSGPGPARRLYEVTSEGKELLRAWVEVIRQNIATLKSFSERYDALGDLQ